MCHIKRKSYVDQSGHRKFHKIRYNCEFFKQGRPCAMTSEDEGEVHTIEVRPATSTGHPSRDTGVLVDQSEETTSRHRDGKSRMAIGTLILETMGARPKRKDSDCRSKRRKEPVDVVIDQAERPKRYSAPPVSYHYGSGAFGDHRQPPPPPPLYRPSTSAGLPPRPTRIEIVDPPPPRRRRETVVHHHPTDHASASPAEPSRLDRLYHGGAEPPRSRHDSVLQTPSSSESSQSPMHSAADDTEHVDRYRARELARKQRLHDLRKQNEEDRRRDEEDEDQRQARIERGRYQAREDQRRQTREEGERLRQQEELNEIKARRRKEEKANRRYYESRQREEEQRRREKRERDDEHYRRMKREHEDWLRRHSSYGHEHVGRREPFPSFHDYPRAPPEAPPYRNHVHVSYGPAHSMRYAPPPSPRATPRTTTHYPPRGYDERHGTYYSEARPVNRIEQRVTDWLPGGRSLFRRNTYSGERSSYRDAERAARRKAMFEDP